MSIGGGRIYWQTVLKHLRQILEEFTKRDTKPVTSVSGQEYLHKK